MSYATGSIVGSPTPSTDFVSLIEAQLTAHPAWEFVETYVGVAYTSQIWKCLGLYNSWGQDFYVAISIQTSTLGTGTIYLDAYEQYNVTTHLGIRGVPNPGSTLTPTADGSAYGNTGYAPRATQWNPYTYLYTSTVNFDYYILVTNNSLLFKSGASLAYGLQAGVFEPVWPHPNEWPLHLMVWGNADTDASGGTSRRPGVTVSSTDTYAIYSYPTFTIGYETLMGSISDTTNTLYASGDAVGARPMIYHTNPVEGKVRGFIPDLLIFEQHADVARGDTVTIDGKVWVCVDDAGTNGLWMNTEAV